MAFYVDDVKVGGATQLIEALGLKKRDVPLTKRLKEFEQNMQRDTQGNPKRDRDGNYETKRKLAGSPEFSVYLLNKGEVRVRWASTQRYIDAEKRYSYTPTLITMDPAEDGTAQFNDQEEFVYWYIHPWCKNSPFYQAGKPFFYEYKDQDGRSKIENEFEETRINALSMIVGRSAFGITQLRTLAKGVNIPGVDDFTDEVVRKKLRDVATADPAGFINKVESREVIFSGKIQDAVDKGVLKLDNLNGMNRWYLNGNEIIPVAYGADALGVLKAELSSQWHLYATDIENGLTKTTISTQLNAPENDAFFNMEQPETVERIADLTDEQRALLRKMDEDIIYSEKIKKLAALDPNDPDIHFMTKKSLDLNIDAVNLYKATLVQPASEAV